MKYPIAERFKSIQGEGLYTGTPMAFIRFVGCSVGKNVCSACDTDFEQVYSQKGGGLYDEQELVDWALPYSHVCFTGGEPLDRILHPIISAIHKAKLYCHIETSGTVHPSWLRDVPYDWITVSPKPGYLLSMIERADEIKLILGGLGSGEGWPTLEDAISWASERRKLVYIQPRNFKDSISPVNLQAAAEAVNAFPNLRLSAQLHKFLEVR
jgi:7-carboxy-7-deazaguanine synthase